MSKETRRALVGFAVRIRKNSIGIRKKLSKGGVKPDPALVFSAAKYLQALNKLAKS